MPQDVSDQAVAAVRRFNRFYTAKLGVLDQHLLASPYSLTEARVLYELAQRAQPTAKEIGAALGLDLGYLSRIIQQFEADKLLTRKPSPSDRRQHQLALTAKGRAAFARLDLASQQAVAAMLGALAPGETTPLTQSMATISRLLGDVAPRAPATLRSPQPGDMGYVVQSHAAVYAAEYGFDWRFEALVAEIVAAFVNTFDAARERCWIAEQDGRPVGSVFLVHGADDVAKLRLMLVEPAARGQKLGERLVAAAILFAREAGYRCVTLWTHSILTAARKIYQDAGFRLVATEPHHSWGQDLIGETWELELRQRTHHEPDLEEREA